MIRAVRRYLQDEAKPRIWSIVKGTELWIGVAVGALAAWQGQYTALRNMTVGELSVIYLTYASIALGFSLAGFTLVLTLPNREFVKRLSADRRTVNTNSYTDLLFIFSWTAIMHWCSIVGWLVLLATVGARGRILPQCAPLWQRVIAGSVIAVAVYAFGQFLITIITLSQAGRVYGRSAE